MFYKSTPENWMNDTHTENLENFSFPDIYPLSPQKITYYEQV